MAKFVKGDVVVVPFPFSDLTQSKRRPALVIAGADGDDLILCQITSQTVKDDYSVPVTDADFTTGSLKQMSNIRPNRIFTARTGYSPPTAISFSTESANSIQRKPPRLSTQW